MDPQALILLALKIGIALVVFALGLTVTAQDVTYVLRRPRLLVRSLVSMNVIMPLFVAAVVATFRLDPAVEIALVALAVSPVPPMLPQRSQQARGAFSHMIGLLVVAAALAIVLVPLSMDLMGKALGETVQVPHGAVAEIVAITVLAPLAAGLLSRRIAGTRADKIARAAKPAALGLLLLALLPVLIKTLPEAWSLIGNGTLAAIVAFVVVGLAVGHLLGGPDPDQRTVLALATGCRHPGVAMAIASTAFPQQKLALAAIVLYLLVNVVVTIPYLVWSRRRHELALARELQLT